MVSLCVTINYCRELNHLINIVLNHCYLFIFKSQQSFYSFHSYANVSWKYIVWKKSCSEYIVSYISINFGGEKNMNITYMLSLHLIMQVNNEWWFLFLSPNSTPYYFDLKKIYSFNKGKVRLFFKAIDEPWSSSKYTSLRKRSKQSHL